MLGQQPSCCRAVQRRLRVQTDVVWITDDILSKALQQFCIGTQQSRRNGSSVPGPLESRRRMGRRRMTQLSQYVPASPQVFGGLWSFGGAPNRDQWQWEPPSTRPKPTITPPLPPTPESSFLPHLLEEWLCPVPEDQAEVLDSETRTRVSTEAEESFSTCLSRFQFEIRGAPLRKVDELCSQFAMKAKEYIIFGVASKADLERSVDIFDREVLRAAGSRTHSDNHCLSFYRAIWEGFQTCPTSSPELIGVQALETFGRRMAHIEDLSGAQDLALTIIRTVPSDRLPDIEESITFLVQYWNKRFRKSRHYKLESLESSFCRYRLESLKYSFNPRRDPLMIAVQSVASFLEELPVQLAHTVIRKNTEVVMRGLAHGISDTTFVSSPFSGRRRFLWMLTVANTRCTSEALLVDTWRMLAGFSENMDHSYHRSSNLPSLTSQETCSILLDYLTSQKKITRHEQIVQALAHKLRNGSTPLDSGVIIATLGENFSGMAAISFVRILAKVGGPAAIRDAVQLLRRDGTKIRESRVVSMIRDIPHTQPRDAFELFKAHHHLSSGLFSPLKLEQFPALVVALINHPETNPLEIWGHLQKGLWTRLRRHASSLPRSSKRLSEQKIALVYKMAEAFAGAKHLSDGVAFRNVVHCARYLRRHRIPLTSKMSKALTRVGIIRALDGRRWPGTTKSRWILNVIEREEGQKVADIVDNVLTGWRRSARFRQ